MDIDYSEKRLMMVRCNVDHEKWCPHAPILILGINSVKPTLRDNVPERRHKRLQTGNDVD